MKTFGIDISKWNGSYNLLRAKSEGAEFVIIRAGGADDSDGCYTDSEFERNYVKAKSAGLHVGAYFYTDAENMDEAIKEADYFAGLCDGKTFDLPVYVDVEQRMLRHDRSTLTKIVKAFCDRMEDHGFWVGIYASLSAFRDHMNDDDLLPYAHWVAQWYRECTYKHPEVLGLWQFGGETNPIRSNRVAGRVTDQDYMLVDYPAMIRKACLNGYGAPAPRPAEPVALKPGAVVKLKPGTRDINNGRSIAGFVYDTKIYVKSVSGDRVAVTINSDLSGTTAWVSRDRILV